MRMIRKTSIRIPRSSSGTFGSGMQIPSRRAPGTALSVWHDSRGLHLRERHDVQRVRRRRRRPRHSDLLGRRQRPHAARSYALFAESRRGRQHLSPDGRLDRLELARINSIKLTPTAGGYMISTTAPSGLATTTNSSGRTNDRALNTNFKQTGSHVPTPQFLPGPVGAGVGGAGILAISNYSTNAITGQSSGIILGGSKLLGRTPNNVVVARVYAISRHRPTMWTWRRLRRLSPSSSQKVVAKNMVAPRHNRACNVLMVDGSVRAFDPADIDPTTPSRCINQYWMPLVPGPITELNVFRTATTHRKRDIHRDVPLPFSTRRIPRSSSGCDSSPNAAAAAAPAGRSRSCRPSARAARADPPARPSAAATRARR